MRRYLSFVAMAIFILQAGVAAAAGSVDPVVYFEIPPGLFGEACKKKVWTGVEVKWEGTTDFRQDKSVGLQVKKGGEQIRAYSDPALEITMDAALRDILQECGMALVDRVPADGIRIKANIREFFVDVIKNVVSSHVESQSTISFDIYRGKSVSTIDIGVTVKGKGVRRGKIKALANAANKLLAETLKAVPENRHMKEIR